VVAVVTQAKRYGPGVLDLDRDRANRLMMYHGSKLLLDTLIVRHPRIVRMLQTKHSVVVDHG
jgi:hypothetical protein